MKNLATLKKYEKEFGFNIGGFPGKHFLHFFPEL